MGGKKNLWPIGGRRYDHYLRITGDLKEDGNRKKHCSWYTAQVEGRHVENRVCFTLVMKKKKVAGGGKNF